MYRPCHLGVSFFDGMLFWLVGGNCRKFKLIESNAKCRYKKLTCKETLRPVFICQRPPPLLDFCLGWCRNFVGSESGSETEC
jgi:hypothetical protein